MSRGMALLREDLLADRKIVVAGETGVEQAQAQALARLGAGVLEFDPSLDDERATEWAREQEPVHGLLYVAGPSFSAGGPGALQTALERTWLAVRAVATGALIPGGDGGRVVLLAPAADAGEFVGAVRAALENLARTLSIEWARYGITTTALAPRARTSDADVATLVAFLFSAAGGYFSGCRFELGALIRSSS